MTQKEAALADAVLMVRPAAFASNPETVATNRFQAAGRKDSEAVKTAQAEFDTLARMLDEAGVEVMQAEDTAAPAKPDAVFPTIGFQRMPTERWCCIPCTRPIAGSKGARMSLSNWQNNTGAA